MGRFESKGDGDMPKVTVTTTVQYTKSGNCKEKCPHFRRVIDGRWVAGCGKVCFCSLFDVRLEEKEFWPMRHRKCIEAENGGGK